MKQPNPYRMFGTLASTTILACAYGTASAETSTKLLDRVMITGDPDRIEEIPGSAQALDREALDRHSHTDPHRILRDIPGVTVLEEEGYGQFPHISMRGTPPERGERVTIMEDGVLVAPAPYAAPAGYYFPPIGRMDRVETRKGSSSIKYGPYTVGGALNMVSTPIPRERSGKADILFGSHNGRRMHAHIGGQEGENDQWGWLVEGYTEQSDGFKDLDNALSGPNQPEPNTGFDRRNLMTKLRWNSDPMAELYQEVEFKFATDERTVYDTYLGLTEQDYADDPYRRYAGSQIDEINTENDKFMLRHYIQPTANVDITTTIYRTETVRNWYKLHEVSSDGGNSFTGIGDILDDPEDHPDKMDWIRGDIASCDDDNDSVGDVRANNREYFAHGLDVQMGYLFDAFGWEHELESGLRYHQDEEDRLQWHDSFAMEDGMMYKVDGSERDTPGDVTNRLTEAEAIAGFVQNTMRQGSWTVTPGVRYEYVDVERRDWNDPNRSSANLDDDRPRSNTYREWIPGIGAVYDIDRRWSVLAGVHRGFAPGGSDPDGEAEESNNYELGARFRDAYTQAELIGFFNDYSNINAQCTQVGGGCEDEDDVAPIGEVEVYGLEATWLHDLGASQGWGVQVPVSLTYTLTRSEFRENIGKEEAPNNWAGARKGDSLPEIPEHEINARIGLAQEDWRINLAANWTDSVKAKADPDYSHQEIDSRVLIDLSGEYYITEDARLFAAAENLTDEEYVAHWRPAGARPGKPREFWAGIKVDF
ncbi:TonB-dependent receptor family protein [Halorhodospira halochloris]|uniref:TonB-dependent receptor family protein n=1 Tax=Halorhodospira halochloris TaxID=1052 RepID=UPI001EE87772|nr:TonB-dependent receptor [Halorhodospira halochloris]MCG5548280.1 TonB-dependent receptor [Halorhodospira halochloris]